MNIETLLPQLILRHECLIIPEWGGFVSRNVPAQIDWKIGTIHAPNKELIFNTFLQKNDGVLAAAIAQSLPCSYEEACAHIKQLVAEWKQTLQNDGRVEIEKVGFLYREANGTVRFEQTRFFNLLLASFGMGELTFISHKVEKLIETAPSVISIAPETAGLEASKTQPKVVAPKTVRLHAERTTQKAAESLPIRNKKKMPWKIAAAAVLLPLGFFAYWLPMHTPVLESGKIALSDFNPFHITKEASYSQKVMNVEPVHAVTNIFEEQTKELSPSVSIFNYAFNETLYIPIRIHEKTVETSAIADTPEASYHLIGGCFSSSENTEDFIQSCKEKGLNAFVVETKGGLSRVSVAQSNEKTTIQQTKADLASKGIETWLLSK